MSESYKELKTKIIEEAKKKHNNYYNYSKVEFNKMTDKITINCPHHGDFSQLLNSHLKGYGCFKCGSEESKKTKIEKSKNFFGVMVVS